MTSTNRPIHSVYDPTRHYNGVTNVHPRSSLNLYPAMDPSRTFEFFDDFQNPVDLIASSPATWTLTHTAGTGAITQLTGANGIGGRIQIATTNGGTDSTQIQANSDGFTFVAGQRWWMKFLFQVSNVADTDVILGLQKIGTTPLAATDGIWYRQTNGAGTGVITIVAAAASTTTSATINTNVAATDVSIGLSYDPWKKDDSGKLGCIFVYVNDVQAPVRLSVANMPLISLAPVMYIKSNSANARNLAVDYFFAANDRPTYQPIR